MVLFWVGEAKGSVFHLPFDVPDTQTMGQRCVYVERFKNDLSLFGGEKVRQSTQFVELASQLDQNGLRAFQGGYKSVIAFRALFLGPGRLVSAA